MTCTTKKTCCLSLFVVDDLADAVENLLVVRLHLHGIRPLAEHQEQHGVGHEVKAGESRSLLLQVSLQAFLALFELDEENGEGRAKGLAGTARCHLLGLFRWECAQQLTRANGLR